jgi:hypothetical protein
VLLILTPTVPVGHTDTPPALKTRNELPIVTECKVHAESYMSTGGRETTVLTGLKEAGKESRKLLNILMEIGK